MVGWITNNDSAGSERSPIRRAGKHAVPSPLTRCSARATGKRRSRHRHYSVTPSRGPGISPSDQLRTAVPLHFGTGNPQRTPRFQRKRCATTTVGMASAARRSRGIRAVSHRNHRDSNQQRRVLPNCAIGAAMQRLVWTRTRQLGRSMPGGAGRGGCFAAAQHDNSKVGGDCGRMVIARAWCRHVGNCHAEPPRSIRPYPRDRSQVVPSSRRGLYSRVAPHERGWTTSRR